MTQQRSMKISDPESLIARSQEGLAAIEAIEEMVLELEGAKTRLLELEQSLKRAVASSELEAEHSRRVALNVVEDVSKALETLGGATSELQADWQQQRSHLNAAESEMRTATEATLSDVVSKTESAIEHLDAAATNAARAAEEARAENEAFRREQLTKLDDLRVSHALLSDRQRDQEQQTARALDDQARRVNEIGDWLQRSLESLEPQVRECIGGIQEARESLTQGVNELRNQDKALASRVTRATRAGLVLLSVSWLLLVSVATVFVLSS